MRTHMKWIGHARAKKEKKTLKLKFQRWNPETNGGRASARIGLFIARLSGDFGPGRTLSPDRRFRSMDFANVRQDLGASVISI